MNEFKLDAGFAGCSVSTATLRLCDLVSAGLEFMDDYDRDGLAMLNDAYLDDINKDLYKLSREYPLEFDGGTNDALYPVQLDHLSRLTSISDSHPIWSYDNTILDWLWHENIFDRLNEIAPQHCYFGAHEGDGADIGFWLSWDYLHEEIKYSLFVFPRWLNLRLPAGIVDYWQEFNNIADYLESLDHETIPDLSLGQLSQRYALWLVKRWYHDRK